MRRVTDGGYSLIIQQKKNLIATTSYATKWYITLFSNTVPFHTQLRIWDALFLEGPDVLVVLAVAIIWGYRGTCTGAALLLHSLIR